MMKCLPILWAELTRLKSRVESVINTLTSQNVQEEKENELQHQLVSNKSLKQYFEENPGEKEIQVNDTSLTAVKNDRFMFKNLDVMPSYVIPEAIMALTQ